MTDWMQVTVRSVLALMLGALAWEVTHDYVLLTKREALLVGILTVSAGVCRPKGAWRILTLLLLTVTLLGFWYILRDRMADRNLVLVGILAALTGFLASRVND